jgi:hypothetical protein
LSTIKDRVKQINWKIAHDGISRSHEKKNNEFDLHQCINKIIEWLNRDFLVLTRD